MSIQAFVVHRLPQRARLRIPELSGNAEHCDRLAESLGECPGVVSVRANPVTASVLIEHSDDGFDVVARYGRDMDLFDLDEGPTASEGSPGAFIEQGLTRLDTWIRSETRNQTNLKSFTIAALTSCAVWQAARGQLLPTAAQLIWYVLSLTPDSEGRTHAGREG
jgi:Heavy metal associated domain 2